jgi:hypothetical protein
MNFDGIGGQCDPFVDPCNNAAAAAYPAVHATRPVLCKTCFHPWYSAGKGMACYIGSVPIP